MVLRKIFLSFEGGGKRNTINRYKLLTSYSNNPNVLSDKGKEITWQYLLNFMVPKFNF